MSTNLIYEPTISEKLNPFISSLKKLITKYQNTIVGISQSLPKIENQIDDNVLEARELLNFIFSAKTQNTSYGVTHEISQFHKELNNALKTLERSESEDKEIFEKLRESIELSTYAIQKTKDIQNISESLKVFAINSIVYSQKAGIKGKGYQVISTEFIRLSEAIAGGTEKINLIGNEMFSQINDFHGAIKKHEDFARTKLEAISKDSGKLLEKANKSVENFSLILNDLLNRIEKVKDPTFKIMIELQKQDIIQQQLEHLMEAMQDITVVIEKNDSNIDERSRFTLLNILMITIEKQIERISGDIIGMIDSMESLFDQMSTSIEDIDLDKNQFSVLVTSGTGENNNNQKNVSIVDMIFQTPGEMIRVINQDQKKSIQNKEYITSCFSGIEEKIRDEKDLALQFIPVIESIKNLLILAQIEQARYELNISGQTSSSDLSFFSENSYEDLSDIVEEIKSAHEEVTANLEESRILFTSQKENLKGLESQLTSSQNIIAKTREMFLENFNLVINITNELFKHVIHHVVLFKDLRQLVNNIKDEIHICTEIKEGVQQKLDNLGGSVTLEQSVFKDLVMKKIVERCTVDTERITLSQEFEELEIEESSSNNITLF